MVFDPITKGKAVEAEPDATIAPLTLTVAPVSLFTGVSVIDAVPLGTLAV